MRKERVAYLDVSCGRAFGETRDLNNVATGAGALDGEAALVTNGILEGPVCDAKVHLGSPLGSVGEPGGKRLGVLVVKIMLPGVVHVCLWSALLLRDVKRDERRL